MSTETRIRLDHASLRVAEFDAARARLARLGLELTQTPEAPERHGRIHLHRTYVEVSLPTTQPLAPGHEAELPLFFLNAEDVTAAAGRLSSRGLKSTPRTYHGVDGVWEELQLESPASSLLPLVIRRVAPTAVAQNWPPPRPTPHPCGAVTLEAVVLVTKRLEVAWDSYRRLLGLEGQPRIFHDAHYAARRAEVPLPNGRLVLLEAGGPGPAETALARHGPGPAGVQFGVQDLLATEAFLAQQGLRFERSRSTAPVPELWLDPSETFGVPLGFIPASPLT